MSPKEPGDPRAELARLKAKMTAIDDREIRAVLQTRVDELTAQVEAMKPVEPETPEEPLAPTPPPTPEQIDRSERLVRQAMLEKQRGNKAAVTKLLEEAVAVAPGAPATLEALGDDFAERGRVKEALDCYKRALAVDPKNVGIDRKHAMLVFRVGNAGSIEDQLRANLSESPFLNRDDAVASYPIAKMLSFFFPGLGHIVLGRPGLGFGLLGTWVACLVWIGVVQIAAGGQGKLNNGVWPPILIAVIVLVIAVATLGSDKAAARKSAPSRPRPPVDLPFE